MKGNGLVLSIFPGIDLLGRAFEEEGWCTVRGPDFLWGGDIREFHPPSGVFEGVIGGDPCQAHSRMVALVRATGHEPRFPDFTPEFARVVSELQSAWFLRENVPGAPDLEVDGYAVCRFEVNASWFGAEQDRRRWVWFGVRGASPVELWRWLDVDALRPSRVERCVMASEGRQGKMIPNRRERVAVHPRAVGGNRTNARGWERVCELQGLPDGFTLPGFLKEEAFRAVGNGVPMQMGRALARAVRVVMGKQVSDGGG